MFDKKLNEIMETGLFAYYIGNLVYLKGTNFKYNVATNGWGMVALQTISNFEYVLENVPMEIQTKLLFHLDLFR